MKGAQRYDGEWFDISVLDQHYIVCCDCGLVHEIDYAIVKDDNHVLLKMRRVDKATAQQRSKKECRASIKSIYQKLFKKKRPK